MGVCSMSLKSKLIRLPGPTPYFVHYFYKQQIIFFLEGTKVNTFLEEGDAVMCSFNEHCLSNLLSYQL